MKITALKDARQDFNHFHNATYRPTLHRLNHKHANVHRVTHPAATRAGDFLRTIPPSVSLQDRLSPSFCIVQMTL